jgi:hypothetical protein
MRNVTMIVMLVLAAALLPAAALGKDSSNPGVIKRGKCTNGASWKLKGKNDHGLIEAEFEVDQNRNGRRWNVVLRRNGSVVFRGVRVTRAPSGSFSLERRISGRAGADRIVAVATTAGGRCVAALSV